jgi:hypothetical protein
MKKFIEGLIITVIIVYFNGACLMSMLNVPNLTVINPFAWPWEITRISLLSGVVGLGFFCYPFDKGKNGKRNHTTSAREMRDLIQS